MRTSALARREYCSSRRTLQRGNKAGPILNRGDGPANFFGWLRCDSAR